MAEKGFENYKLGVEGIDIDSSELHRSPFSLRKAQNAVKNPLGIGGGLVNRPGLTKHNAIAFAGSVGGGVSMPLASFVDTRTLYLAAQDGASAEKWYSSADLFGTSGVAVTAIGAWQDPTAYFSAGGGLSRMGVFLNGQLYYASANYTSGTTSPTIRVFNGVDDREISKLLPATTLGITGIFADKGTLYILTLDSGTTDANFVGRVFSMDPLNGHLTQIGAALTTGHVPVSLAVYNGQVYVGTARVTTTNEAVVLRINPLDESVWTTDLNASADDYAITSLVSFRGLLYGTTKNGGAATKGKILQRSIAGSWSTVDSTSNNTGTYDGSAVFGGALYVSSRSYSTLTNTAVVRKSTDGSSWSTVSNATSTAGYGLMTVIGLRIFSMFGTTILHSLDGASWTAATHGSGGNADGALGILFGRGDAQWSDPTTATDTGGTSTINVTNVTNSPTVNESIILWVMPTTSTATTGPGSGIAGINNGAVGTTDAEGTWVDLTSAASGTQCSYRMGQVGRTINDLTVQFKIRTGSDLTNVRLWIGLTTQANSFANSDTQSADSSVAFRYSTVASDTGWHATANAGASQTVGTTSTTIAASTVYVMKIILSLDGTKAEFYINGVLVDTITTNLPATSTSLSLSATMIPQAAATKHLEVRLIACKYPELLFATDATSLVG